MSYNPQNPNGQATMENSKPVVVASNQSALPVTVASLQTDALTDAELRASFVPVGNFLMEVQKGNVAKHSIIHQVGHNASINGTLAPLSDSAVYQTPTAAVSLEFVSSAAGDALNGAGMHEITLVGLDANWNEQTVVMAAHATDGTIAVAIPGTWLRFYKGYISRSGTYATAVSGSHIGTITVRVAGGGVTYGTIALSGAFPSGQTQIGAYTIPIGFTGYLLSVTMKVSAAKNIDFLGFQRSFANDVATPFSGAIRLFLQALDVSISSDLHPSSPIGVFVGPCDIGFMGKTSTGTSSATVDFELLLVQD